MAKLTNQQSRMSKVLNNLYSQERVVFISASASSKLDSAMESEFKKIKEDFESKERISRACVSKLELTSLIK